MCAQMLIAGLEKLSLLDYPDKMCAIVFTYGCNMLCPYCHNPELVVQKLNRSNLFSEEDVIGFLRKRVGKIDALTITGGEPTMHHDLLSFIERVKKLGFLVKLDTNGSNPDRVKVIVDSGMVDYWAMDVKYSDELYRQGLNGGQVIEGIGESIKLIMNSGSDYEFRTTVMKGLHSEDSIHEIGKMIKGAKNYYIQNFRAGKTIDPKLNVRNSFNKNELLTFAQIMEKYVGRVIVRGL